MNPQHYATHNPQQFYGGNNSAAYATQGGMNAPMGPALHVWTPSPQEQQYYDFLFAHADEQHRNVISGQQAVAFFTRSHVDKAVLREVWNIADSQQKSELSRNEFYVAMRLIAMAQRGDQVTLQRFHQVAGMPYPLPMMEGMQPQQQGGMPSHQQQVQQQQQQQQFQGQIQHQQQGFGSTSGGPYAMTADEKSKYDVVFQQYDMDHDGFLMGQEAVALFQMSGLDRNVLRDVWSMADATQDSKLSLQEFYVAMHLIVCVSKRGLPMPQTLPRELAESAFGTSSAAGGANHPGSVPSQNGFASQPQQSAPPAPQPEGMSAFDSLSTVEDVPLPTLSSSQSSRTGSFNHADTSAVSSNDHAFGFGEPAAPTTTTNIQSGFPPAMGQQDFPASRTPNIASGTARDRTNSASSMNSMSSFSGMAPLMPQQPHQSQQPPQHLPPRSFGSNERIQMPRADSAQFQTPPQSYHGMSGFGGFEAPQSPAVATGKPFMSDEEEKSAVQQLDRQNDAVVQTLAGVERKQNAIELLSEKLRDLDELRHELVSLIMRREIMRSKLSVPTAVDDPAEAQSRHLVERSLRVLVENEKLLIHQLQCDVLKYEGELEEAILSAKLQQKLSIESRSPLIDAASPQQSGGSGFNAFSAPPLSLDGSSASITATPSAPTISPFSPGQSLDRTDSSGFNAFSNFDSAPRSIGSAIASPAAAIPAPLDAPFSPPSQHATESNNSFDAFGSLPVAEPAPAEEMTQPSFATAPGSAQGNSPFSPIPSPAVASNTSFDAFDAPPSSNDSAAPLPGNSLISPTPAPTSGNGLDDFGDFNAAPSSSPVASGGDALGQSPFSPLPSPAPASNTSMDFATLSAAKTEDEEANTPVPVTANSLLDDIAAAPAFSNSGPVSSPPASGNSPFSPVAIDNTGVGGFGDFNAASTDSAQTSFTPPKPAESFESTPFSPTPDAAAPDSGIDTFGAFSAASEDGASPASTTNAPESSPFSPSPSPAAATAISFDTLGDFSESASAPEAAATAPESSPFSPSPSPAAVADSSFDTFGDFSGTPDTNHSVTASATSAPDSSPSPAAASESSNLDGFGDFSAPVSTGAASTIVKSEEAPGSSPFSPVATDTSGFDSFGDFSAASEPAPASGGFEAFGDFSAAPASSDSAATKESSPFSLPATAESNGFGDFGDFSAAPASSDGFGDFSSFHTESAK